LSRLSHEKSAYLRHSAYQKIDWYTWSDEAFQKAKKEDKPVFLSSGAIWCHWCHVMAKECFENEEIIKLLNENFVCIKLDRDERPDIDRRYQLSVAAMGSGGGWPLSVFLSHDRKPFFGGTYFPPEDSFGRPGFKKVLTAVSEFYKSNREKISEYAEKLMHSLSIETASHMGEIDRALIDSAVENMLSMFDPQNGGFGSAPKFPMPGATEFLINRYFFTGSEALKYAVTKTLESMANGGFHDQIGGGFHRYSTDEAWIIPHFEKMADDNAWLLKNYLDAYCIFGNEHFKKIAIGIIKFTIDVLSDPEGGFYSSQDADVSPEDEGGYFTWTEREFRDALNEEEYRILSLHLLHDRGAMHHDHSKKVLFVAMDAADIAKKTGIDLEKIEQTISVGKSKLLEKRNLRKAPIVDTIFYTSLNGMMITAYIKAFRILKDSGIRDFALKSLRRILQMHFIDNMLFHTEGVKGILDDYIYIAEALIAAYEITADDYYLHTADAIMGLCIEKFWDEKNGSFFDTDQDVLGIRLKVIEDVPHPSPNSVGIILMLKLFHLTDKKIYLQFAEKALQSLYSKTKETGIHYGYYYLSLDAYFNILRLSLYTSVDNELVFTALSSCRPYLNISYGEDKGYVIPCLRTECFEPAYNSSELQKFLTAK